MNAIARFIRIASTKALRRRGHVVLVLAAVITAVSASARADDYLEPIGGSGGGKFEAHCPAGELLAGFELRAGDDVDAIRPLCVTASASRIVSAATAENNWHGGSGGGLTSVVCTKYKPIVTGMYVRWEGAETFIVNNIHLFCGVAAEVQVASDLPSALFDGPEPSHDAGVLGMFSAFTAEGSGTQRCADGQVAVGVHGASGKWLDSIGLICGEPALAGGRGKTLGRLPGSPNANPPRSICESARNARERNSPKAPDLEAQCLASTMQAKTTTQATTAASVSTPVARSFPAYVYAVDAAGKLRWYRHDGAGNGTFKWEGPRTVDANWGNFRNVFAGGGGVIYAITQSGTLMRFEHAGFENGLGKEDGGWRAPQELLRGWGNVRQAFSAGHGVIYAITGDGKLLWYRHTGFANGRAIVQGPNEVGHGWNGVQAFSAGDGVFYGIAPNGTLYWYRHVKYLTGEGPEKPGAWDERRQVGTGWGDFERVFSTDNGVIYGIARDGTLNWYHHSGYSDGRSAWDTKQQVGTGWGNLRWVFAEF